MAAVFQANVFQHNVFQIDGIPIIPRDLGKGSGGKIPGWLIKTKKKRLLKLKKKRKKLEKRIEQPWQSIENMAPPFGLGFYDLAAQHMLQQQRNRLENWSNPHRPWHAIETPANAELAQLRAFLQLHKSGEG